LKYIVICSTILRNKRKERKRQKVLKKREKKSRTKKKRERTRIKKLGSEKKMKKNSKVLAFF
jgi:hypothetical protein